MNPPQAPERALSQRLLLGVIVGIALLGIAVVALDWRQAVQVLESAESKWVFVALAFTAISYFCLSAGFAVSSRIFDIAMSRRDLLAIGFVTTTLNNLVSAGGAAGYSARLLFMRRRGQKAGDILAATLLHSFFNTLAVLTLLPLGLARLLAHHPLSPREEVGVGALLGLTCLVVATVTAFVFSAPAREIALRVISGAGRRVLRRDLRPSFDGLDSALTRGSQALRQHPLRLLPLAGLVAVDWTSTVLALDFCMEALGSSPPIGVLITGFAVGVAAGLVSMVPGGLGVQDGSMTGVYVLLGTPPEQAVLASVLFRVVYYLIPFAVSLVFDWALLHTSASREA